MPRTPSPSLSSTFLEADLEKQVPSRAIMIARYAAIGVVHMTGTAKPIETLRGSDDLQGGGDSTGTVRCG